MHFVHMNVHMHGIFVFCWVLKLKFVVARILPLKIVILSLQTELKLTEYNII